MLFGLEESRNIMPNVANAAPATPWRDMWNGDLALTDEIIAEDFVAHEEDSSPHVSFIRNNTCNVSAQTNRKEMTMASEPIRDPVNDDPELALRFWRLLPAHH